jgi:hypothetical protein
MRTVAVLLMLVAAAPAARAAEGAYLTVEGGYGMWNDTSSIQKNVGAQVGIGLDNARLLKDQLSNGANFGLYLGYDIGGAVAVELGAGTLPYLSGGSGVATMAGLAARWHPLTFFVPAVRAYDLSLLLGFDYQWMRMGGDTGRGLDGIAYQIGGTVELYPTKSISLGFTPRYYILRTIQFIGDSGNKLPLTGNVGGSFLSIALSITFHFAPPE